MPHRQYRDADDIPWQVWDIHPAEVARQLRRMGDAPDHAESLTPLSQFAVARELTSGWLCFESSRGRRRLWPIPANWERLPDAELASLCDRAVDAPVRVRRAGGAQKRASDRYPRTG